MATLPVRGIASLGVGGQVQRPTCLGVGRQQLSRADEDHRKFCGRGVP
ncbi:hypothetical protein [Streptomyces brasiliscabiei]|nr:hypothetical protein [Streptomyces brasiliscabiei]